MHRDGTYVIGRSRPAGSSGPTFITLDHPTVSQRHAELVVMGNRYHVTDLDSRNGIWRTTAGQHQRIKSDYVAADERLWFGDCECRLMDLLTTA